MWAPGVYICPHILLAKYIVSKASREYSHRTLCRVKAAATGLHLTIGSYCLDNHTICAHCECIVHGADGEIDKIVQSGSCNWHMLGSR
jgi:hypothetical protein